MTKQSGARGQKMLGPKETGQLIALFNGRQFAEAAALARSLTEQYPQDGFVWRALGAALKQSGRGAEAVPAMQKAVALSPHDAEGYTNLAIVQRDLGRFEDAASNYQKALRINPANVDSTNDLGIVLHQLGRLTEAEECYRRAMRQKPANPATYANLGITLKDLGRLEEAEASYRQALELKPTDAATHNNLGNLLKILGRPDEAEASFRKALQIKPNYAHAYGNLGLALIDLGRLDEAEASFRSALLINPDFAEAHSDLGAVLQRMGRIDDSTASFRLALEIKPNYAAAFSNLLFGLNYHAEQSAEQIFSAYQEYDARFGLPLREQWSAHENGREPERRLKIGYVSPDFRRHSVRHFLEPLLERHDKRVVEVFAYSEVAREDEVTARYKGYADHWISTVGMSNDELAHRIRADRIDILVDVAGHTANNRLQVFARKPAPVLVSWLGYGYTTGLSAIDYLMMDEVSAPVGSEGLFSENLWRLPDCSWVYRPAEGMGPVNSLPALEKGYVTFGSLTRAIRINQRTVRIWTEILRRTEGARLVIDSKDFFERAMRERLEAQFAMHGIGPERLEIGCHTPPWDVLRGIDIGLDCFPHNSGTTLFETLFMGLPYITLAGRPSVGRLGSTILRNAGHPEWIAGSDADYVDMAVALAADVPKLARLRQGLRAEMQASVLMDEQGFAAKVEAAYREMFRKWAAC